MPTLNEPRCEKTCLRGFRPGPTQTGLCNHRRCLEAWNFRVRKKRYCTIRVAKTRALISFAVTAKLICVFVFAYAKRCFFFHDKAQIDYNGHGEFSGMFPYAPGHGQNMYSVSDSWLRVCSFVVCFGVVGFLLLFFFLFCLLFALRSGKKIRFAVHDTSSNDTMAFRLKVISSNCFLREGCGVRESVI